MEDNNEVKSTNQEITKTLEQMNKGLENISTQLVFDHQTGEFVVARPDQEVSADSTTINSIAKDGFAK